ncbi:hypothetical protein [Pseudomonas sp. GOM6]|uniref:hypothetical protein n=1 Tax=Pseudomonas sp. GOM6 TaxID=3036944 RepID=UPI00240A3E1F|nr:hypothetical protein [Pseudomonas sp. GOM6]MDG1579810.1 hypothetical protein [Pseudomonas sp. GOM6]
MKKGQRVAPLAFSTSARNQGRVNSTCSIHTVAASVSSQALLLLVLLHSFHLNDISCFFAYFWLDS